MYVYPIVYVWYMYMCLITLFIKQNLLTHCKRSKRTEKYNNKSVILLFINSSSHMSQSVDVRTYVHVCVCVCVSVVLCVHNNTRLQRTQLYFRCMYMYVCTYEHTYICMYDSLCLLSTLLTTTHRTYFVHISSISVNKVFGCLKHFIF